MNRTDHKPLRVEFHCPMDGCSRAFRTVSGLDMHYQDVHGEFPVPSEGAVTFTRY